MSSIRNNIQDSNSNNTDFNITPHFKNVAQSDLQEHVTQKGIMLLAQNVMRHLPQ